jgi:amino acid adenylation domain-containing protein
VAHLLHQLVSEAARAHPDRAAVRCRGESLSYGELDRASNAVARALIDGGVQRGDRVAILLPKRVETLACLYGVLKSGAAYVPLDPRAPMARSAMVAADCTVKAVVTTAGRAPGILSALAEAGHRPGFALVLGDDEPDAPATGQPDLAIPVVTYAEGTADRPASDPAVPAIEDDLAYILYTSGSTGVPKGVMLTHRNALTFVEWSARRIGVTPQDRLTNHAPLHFDLSVFDLYLAAMGGATVVLVPEEEAYLPSSLAALIRRERITVWYSVPSALMLLVRLIEPRSLPSLRAVVFAGEVYPTKHLRELRRVVPDVALWNLYGPTETNVCTYLLVEDLPEDDRPIPIGRACENTETFVLLEDGSVGGVGEEGELLVRGPTVMKGYWNRPERTARSLTPDPRAGQLGDPVYRTGDMVRLRPDGGYDFLGRRDHQIKSRGYRIELGEVEAALHTHPGLMAAVAMAVPHEEWGNAILAFVVPREGQDLTESALKRHVAQRLPRYMVPHKVHLVDDLPRTSTGKIDRQWLSQLAREGSHGEA